MCQAFGRAVGDDDTLGRREAPIRHPQAGHEMEGHPRLEDRGIARPKAHGAFALIRWIAKADGLSSAVVFHDVEFFQHGEKHIGDILAAVTLARRLQSRLHPLEDGFIRLDEFRRRRAELDRAR